MEKYHPKNSFYETSELKLAALLLAEIPNSHFEITENLNLIKKNIKIIYLNEYSADVERLIREFLERRANVDVYRYNKNLNLLRDKLRE